VRSRHRPAKETVDVVEFNCSRVYRPSPNA
jgi:hypothetical protein